jgi:two-component system OmpR family response regulator
MTRGSNDGRRYMKVLVIGDNAESTDYLIRGLIERGYTAAHVSNGKDCLFVAVEDTYDVLVVDQILVDVDDLGLVRKLRRAGVRTPVLFLTTMRGAGARMQGPDADNLDYLIKPFTFPELLGRLDTLARRLPVSDVPITILRVADLELDLLRRTATRGGERIELTPREFCLLEFLLRHADHVVTPTMLLEIVWDFHSDAKSNIVATRVSRLRSKLNRRGRDQELIHTIRGSGYLLRAATDRTL